MQQITTIEKLKAEQLYLNRKIELKKSEIDTLAKSVMSIDSLKKEATVQVKKSFPLLESTIRPFLKKGVKYLIKKIFNKWN